MAKGKALAFFNARGPSAKRAGRQHTRSQGSSKGAKRVNAGISQSTCGKTNPEASATKKMTSAMVSSRMIATAARHARLANVLVAKLLRPPSPPPNAAAAPSRRRWGPHLSACTNGPPCGCCCIINVGFLKSIFSHPYNALGPCYDYVYYCYDCYDCYDCCHY